MSYYCPRWIEEVVVDDDGETVASLYDQYGCARFDASQDIVMDADGETVDYRELHGEQCRNHGSDAYYENDPYEQARAELNNRFEECTDCADGSDTLIFPDADAVAHHQHDEHANPNLDPDDNPHPLDEWVTPPPQPRIDLGRVVIPVATGRTWFTNEHLPDWLPPLIDNEIRRGNIRTIRQDTRSRQPTAVVFDPNAPAQSYLRVAHVYSDPREELLAYAWNPGYRCVPLYPAPPVRTSHSAWPGATP